MNDQEQCYQHLNPAWRHKSDFILMARLDDDGTPAVEQLWARKLGENEYEICCIPFFVYEIALGDVVMLTPDNEVSEVVRKSGNAVFRVSLSASSQPETAWKDVVKRAIDANGEAEAYSETLLALSVPSDSAPEVQECLEDAAAAGLLVWESG